jgi:hypothetical protein
MALVMLGGGIADMRGSIGGTTFARSAAGNYARARVKPVNPRSSRQNTRRANTAYLMKRWSHALTEQQRSDWRAYATATQWTNRLGQAIEISAIAAYLRLNALQLLIPSAPIDEAPTAMGQGGGVTLAFTAENDTGKLQLAEPGGSWDTDVDIITLWISMGLPMQPGRLSVPKGFRYFGRVWGSSGSPLGFPYEMDAPYTMQLGQLITIKAMFQDEHYRVSGPHWATVVAAPS